MEGISDLLYKQTKEAQDWVDKIIDQSPQDRWFETPNLLNTAIAWQIGHLTLSYYFYTVVLLNGPNAELAAELDLKKYSIAFAKGENLDTLLTDFSVQELIKKWELIKKFSLENIANLKVSELDQPIFKMPTEHPFVKSKLDAISWNVKHTMWHCGQLATLMRVLGQPIKIV